MNRMFCESNLKKKINEENCSYLQWKREKHNQFEHNLERTHTHTPIHPSIKIYIEVRSIPKQDKTDDIRESDF